MKPARDPRPSAALVALVAGFFVVGCGGGSDSAFNPIGVPALVVTTSDLPGGTVGQAYVATLSVAGGVGPFSWSVEDPLDLPPGVSLTASTASQTTLQGLPSAGGTFSFQVRVVDSQGRRGFRTFSGVRIASAALDISPTTLTDAFQYTPYGQTLSATGGIGPYAWGVSSSTPLPTGLALSATTGDTVDIEGVPFQSGSFSFTIEIADDNGSSASRTFTLQVGDTHRIVYIGAQDLAGHNELYQIILGGPSPTPPTKVSGPLVQPGGGVINGGVEISPDRTKVAYRADQEVDAREELYVVDLTGEVPGPARKVNVPLIADGDVSSYLWSPDSTKIVYRADAFEDGVFEIFVADVSGTGAISSIHVSQSLGLGPGQTAESTPIHDYGWSSDSRFVAFLADTNPTSGSSSTAVQDELFVADVSLGGPVTAQPVNQTLPSASADIDRTLWALDAPVLFFIGDQVTSTVKELYFASIGPGGTVTPGAQPVSGVLASNEDVSTNTSLGQRAQLSSDGSRLGFLVTPTSAGRVFFVELTNGVPGPRIEVAAGAGNDVDAFVWSPDSQAMVIAFKPSGLTQELFYVDLSGATPAAPVQVNSIPSSSISTGAENEFGFSPGGGHIFLRDTSFAFLQEELFVSSLSGMTPGPMLQVNPTVTSTGGVTSGTTFTPLVGSPDDLHLAFLLEETDDISEAFLYDYGAPAQSAVQVAPDPVAGGEILDLRWTADSRFLLLRGDAEIDGVFELYSFEPATGTAGTVQKIHPDLGPGQTIVSYKVVD